MKPVKSLFLKTYGKQRRKLPAWISPENRKRVFDSTDSTDGDISVFEPAKPARTRERSTSVVSRRGARAAKKKAMLCLTEKTCDEENFNNEENIVIPSPPHPQAPQQSETTRGKKTRGCSGRVHPAKRKAVSSLTDNSSDEENIGRPFPQCPQPAQQSKTTRKSQLTSVPGVLIRQKRQQVPVTSESEEDSRVHHRSVGRFVTRRRCGAVVKPKLQKTIVSIFNSSDDFTSGAIRSNGTRQHRKRRKVPPAFLVSSAENSVNDAGTFSFATSPLREISLNESADRSVGPSPRNPIFCSTPSAGSFSKHPHLKPIPINDKSSSPPSMSVSSTCVISTFKEDLNSPGQPVSEPYSAPSTGLHSEGKLLSSLGEQVPHLHHHEELSGDVLMEHTSTNKRSSCSEDAKSYSENSKTKNGDELSSLIHLSSDSENSCEFVSAAGGLEWLIEALKEQCLTKLCTVQLERLDILTMTQLCSETTYSSCLELLSSDDDPLSVDSSQTPAFDLHLSVTDNTTRDHLELINSFESTGQAVSVTDTASVACEQPPECSSASVFYDESTQNTESSVDFIMDTQLRANGPVKTLFTEEKAAAVKDTCLAKKCTVQLEILSLPQMTKQEESPLTCNNMSDSLDAVRSENDYTHNIDDPEDLTCSGDATEGMTVSDRWSINSSRRPVAHTQSSDPETEEKAAVISMLKEKCLSVKPAVEIKRLTLSQLRHKKRKSSSAMSDPASDEQIKNDHQSVSDANLCHGNTYLKVSRKKWSSTSSEDKISSDKEVVKSSCDVLPKRKKLSLAPRDKKMRSTSTDQPGTTRKACVSGLSVSRWKNKSSTHTRAGEVKPVDCSINELISTKHKQQRELGTVMNFSTPVKANPLNLSSLLADFTPNTHTWSRLKAALSVHRKVHLTPRSLHLSPGRTALAELSQDLFATPFRTLFPKHLQSQLCHDTPCEDTDLSDAEKVYAECGQKHPLPWEDSILPHRMKRCVKIGEGTFGEVFSTTNASGDTVALKIIPVEGSEKVNGETQKIFGEILHEIIISKELSSLKEKKQNQTHGFIGLNDLHCVRGCYPPDFLNAWDKFDQQKGSENDRPDFFEKDQLFLILEFEFGGVDLENSNGTLASLGVAKSILHQVTAALAVAEEELHFEHRDLHWGNVLVKTTKQKTGSFLLNGTAHSLETKGVLVRIIDYSLSRLEIDDLTVSCDISKDEELFMGQGDYQFDIYRLMRQENGNNWSNFHPHTNVLWLHYLCSKLLSMKYRSSGGRGAKDIRAALTRFYDNVLQYSSATEALQTCPMFQ
ncbi:serine/threonine-protein kinase haspin [Hippoglossus hippoglossus]|uniref:serine/threonine-protein kinase haspin n=1 Tax=Hippoglossus hippoglossus TaxID=8267 RepID=UPI00148C37B7|nr:serine/threonine-protein kinase haspin [Hippoglossus hippoglossus]